MKVSLKWLAEYVDVPDDLKAFCDRLDLTGTGVEGAEVLGAALEGVVVGEVLSCVEHPDSDHMHVVEVNVGAPEPLQIVCGAPNIAAGIKLPVATVGAVLPGDVRIKKGKLRGVVSCGMCCSKRELGLGTDHDGIWVLPQDAPVGAAIAEYLQMTDTVLDLEITPNRPDCLSMAGMAREVAAMYGLRARQPLAGMAEKLGDCPRFTCDKAPVVVEVPEAARCPRYTATVIRGVKVGPSPEWLAERVTAAGCRSINNIVDVTNYILFLFGQPLHAFDYDTLAAQGARPHIIVRAARDGELLTTLDETERTLTSDMTVIATPERAVALAGVMGGLDTEVTDATVNVLLEAATFESGRTSRTSRNLGLISESSMRYERRVDDNGIDAIAAAAAALMVEVAGGSICEWAEAGKRQHLVDAWRIKTESAQLSFRIPRFRAMMGADIPFEDVVRILIALGCEVSQNPGGEVLTVLPPTFRPDLEREIDLYEEVLRLYGMDRIPATLPASAGRLGRWSEAQKARKTVEAALRASGVNETMTYAFAQPADVATLRLPAAGLGTAVELLNPLNADQGVMRQTLIPGLLRSVSYNQSRGVKNVQLYEIGAVFYAREGKKKPKERQKLACVLAGAMGDAAWNAAPAAFDFFDGKGVVENIARELALPRLRFKALSAEEAPHLQPGRAAAVYTGGTELGWLGEIHPQVADAFEAAAPVVAFELDLEALVAAARPARDYIDVPQFPAMSVDLAFVVDEDVTCERMLQCIQGAGGNLLESVALFDVFRDEVRVGAGKKSLAFALVYRAPDRTLTSDEVESARARVIKKVSGATGAEVRA